MGVSWWARLRGAIAPPEPVHEISIVAQPDPDPESDLPRVPLASTEVHRVLHGALHDPLTGLPEQALLLDRLEQAMTRARRLDTGVALLVVHIEDVPSITARYGRPVLDRILREIASRVTRTLRESDTAARYGESDFAVLCDLLRTNEDLALVAGRLAAALDPPYDVRFGKLAVRAALHLVMPGPASTPLTLLDEMDETLREAAG